jgi:uncharacterized delta-60 repeat protein
MRSKFLVIGIALLLMALSVGFGGCDGGDDDGEGYQWLRSYGGTGYDIANFVQATSDGGCIVAGDTGSFGAGGEDVWVLRLDQEGNIQWQRSYGGTDDEVANSIQETSDGGYIVAGDTWSFGAGDDDFWVLKLDQYGNIQWQRSYGGSDDDIAFSIQETSGGGYIVAGITGSFGAGGGDIWVLRLDQYGNIQWQKCYGGSDDEYALSIQESSDGGYLVAGYTESFGAGAWDAWVLKLDQNGNVQWQRVYGGSSLEVAFSMQATSDGGCVMAGATGSFGAGGGDVWVLRLDQNGNIQWQKCYGGTDFDAASCIQVTSDGGYIVAGGTESFGAGDGDAWVLRLDQYGNVQWQRVYGGSYVDRPFSIQVTSDGGYIVAGRTESFGVGGDFWVLRLDSDGDIPGCPMMSNSNASIINTSVTGTSTAASVTNTSVTPVDTFATFSDTYCSLGTQCSYP